VKQGLGEHAHKAGQSLPDALAYGKLAENPQAVLIFGPAMGIGAAYYEALCADLAEHRLHVFVIEQRGLGHRTEKPSHQYDFGYDDLVQEDLNTAVAYVEANFPQLSIVIGGHSLGAQMGMLYKARYPDRVKGVLMLASGTPHFWAHPHWRKAQLFTASMLFDLSVAVLGYLPGKRLGFAGHEAKTLMRNWSYLCRRGQFAKGRDGFNYEVAIGEINDRVAVVSFDTDAYAPLSAVQAYNRKLRQAKLSHALIKSSDWGKRFDHFNWVKEGDRIAATVAEKALSAAK
jgi:predicted alpha/beta hydrolase